MHTAGDHGAKIALLQGGANPSWAKDERQKQDQNQICILNGIRGSWEELAMDFKDLGI